MARDPSYAAVRAGADRQPRVPVPAGRAAGMAKRLPSRLPSLESLRVFEAAARHLSFTCAAAELHVTQGAVSHRVQALEAELGQKLFERLPRGMALTAQGERLAGGMAVALATLVETMAALSADADAGELVVSVLPSFASRWLIPRLARFRAAHPAIEVRLLAHGDLVNLRAGGVDVAIRFGTGEYPGHVVVRLMGDCILPVCSPELLRRHAPATIADLPRMGLIHDWATEHDASATDWRAWLRHAGIAADARWQAGARFNQAHLAIEAAVSGLGVAMARRSLVADDLAAGRLAQAWPQAAPTAYAYYLVAAPDAAARGRIACFRAWLEAEAGRFRRDYAASSAIAAAGSSRPS